MHLRRAGGDAGGGHRNDPGLLRRRHGPGRRGVDLLDEPRLFAGGLPAGPGRGAIAGLADRAGGVGLERAEKIFKNSQKSLSLLEKMVYSRTTIRRTATKAVFVRQERSQRE